MAFLQNPLGRRLVTLMILASATLSLFAAGVQLYFSYQADLERLQDEIEVVETSFLSGLEKALWEFNFSQAEVLIDGIHAQPDIIAVGLVTATGQDFTRGDSAAPNTVERKFSLIHAAPDGQAIPVGELTVTSSLQRIQARLRGQFLTLAASNFLKTLAASVIMLLIFERLVARHLQKITSYISKEGWDTQVEDLALESRTTHGQDDLQSIVEALNRSRQRLQSTQARSVQLTQKIEVARHELGTIFNAATSGIIAFGADGRVVRINNRARHFLGAISDAVPFEWPERIQFLDAETLHPLDNSADPVRRALAGNTLRNETHLMRRLQDGDDQRYVRVESARPENTDSVIHTVLVIDDISQEERNRQVVERKSRLDALGQLTGGIAHDFNNLLASLVYAVDLARRAKTEEKRETYLETAMSSLVRGRTLTSRLLAFARKQPGLASVTKTSDVFEEFQELVRPMMEAQIEIEFIIEEPDLRQYCDATQLETALMNLTLNARDAMLRSGKGNKIDIRARAVRAPVKHLDQRQEGAHEEVTEGSSFRYVEISVMDNGPGMNDETLARCTDPFFTTKDSNSGTGLGLAMVYGFVRQSDGDLRIYSEEGIGTTVLMTLPRGSDLGGREHPMQEDDVIQGNAQTILVVEDEIPLLTALTEILRELDYQVISAQSGPAALEMVEAGEPFDLLLTDVVMPGAFGGFELARRVRQLRPRVPVLYTSGYTGFSAQEMGEVQAPLLRKPALPRELSAAIAEAIASSEDQ